MGVSCVSIRRGSAVIEMVQVALLHAYLNRGDLLHDQDELTRQLNKALEHSEPAARSVSTVAPGFRQRRLADRLDGAQVQAIISAFEAGTPRWQLAEQHKISIRSVGRLLRVGRASKTQEGAA
jgi:hypothetical protein